MHALVDFTIGALAQLGDVLVLADVGLTKLDLAFEWLYLDSVDAHLLASCLNTFLLNLLADFVMQTVCVVVCLGIYICSIHVKQGSVCFVIISLLLLHDLVRVLVDGLYWLAHFVHLVLKVR
jgi:hypothetical protein